MKLKICCISDMGCVRTNNEDMASIGFNLIRDKEQELEETIIKEKPLQLLVSDGMGGHEHGELASQLCLEIIRVALLSQKYPAPNPEIFCEWFKSMIEEISRRLNQKAEEQGQDRAMGCTLTGLILVEGYVYLINVGDSRCYRLRDSIMARITTDQTYNERDLTPMPEGKALYSCVGGGIEPTVEIEDISGTLFNADRFLICSDGLTDMVDDELIKKLLSIGDINEAGRSLVEAAKAAGGIDNISIIIADVEDEVEEVRVEEEEKYIPEDNSPEFSESVIEQIQD